MPSIAVLHEETPLCVFLHYTTKRHFCRQCLSTLGSFSFDKTNVEPEHAACNAVMGKYMAELYTGTLDIDEMLPTIQEELRVAGYETVMAEAQAQLDAYLAAEAAD